MTTPDRFFVELRTALLRIRVERSYWRNVARDRDAEMRRLAARAERLEAELAEAEALIAKVDEGSHAYFRAVGRELLRGHDFGEAACRLVEEVWRLREQVASLSPSGGFSRGGGRYAAVDLALEDETGGCGN